MIIITVLGKPVSKNRAYGINHGRVFLTTEAKRWKELVGWCAKTEYKHLKEKPRLDLKWNIDFEFYWNDGRTHDGNNGIMLILDALEGIFYNNDTQVLSGSWKIKRGEPKVKIMMTQYENQKVSRL